MGGGLEPPEQAFPVLLPSPALPALAAQSPQPVSPLCSVLAPILEDLFVISDKVAPPVEGIE